jgi:DNA-binding PadR family transcriptional regulator
MVPVLEGCEMLRTSTFLRRAKKQVCACEGHTLDRLLQPTVMALLTEGPQHVYEILRRLRESPLMDGKCPDPTGVYRLLETMEEQGLVSHAVTPSEEGPSKRLYALTRSGNGCMGNWIRVLKKYQRSIGDLVAMMEAAKTR